MFYAAGANEHGQLGNGTYSNVMDLSPINISAHHYRQKTYRQLGPKCLADFASLDERSLIGLCKIKQIACGKRHTMILTEENDLYACGDNSNSQLGVYETISNNTVEWIDFEPARTSRITSIACSSNSSFIFLENGEMYKTSPNKISNLSHKNSFFKLTIDSKSQVKNFFSSPTTSRFHILTNDNSVFVGGEDEQGFWLSRQDQALKPTSFPIITNPIKIISSGGFHTVIITEKNEYFSLGGNYFYQRGDTDDRAAIREGTNLPFSGKAISQVCCGHFHTLVLCADGSLYACGKNSHGQLGSPTLNEKNLYMKVPINAYIHSMLCGTDHTVLLSTDKRVMRCGKNDRGQIFIDFKKQNSSFEMLKVKEFAHLACGAHFTICYGDMTYVINRFPKIASFLKRTELSDVRIKCYDD
ncbi:predicted protein [Naegleria gruberi]|uniref:Predicted protein n=1 Tax=Naegleria gruberi TaxID=5762 RepID=D2V8S6_NAEGR|nr:uncharacterized protein NAEGRDRAFT_57488 [Naegleria gruberi]EFC46741.1 predicted protein [Naegleria gruberi]|eukprot:XP_002679485.1 predicted protein [Naegleria gruberi strain NEG-M]